MRLLGALIAGVRGAEGGTAKVYRRGTSTPATVYQNFEGTQVQSAAGALTLDSRGGCEAYVAELVDVAVYDASGVVVREWTDGGMADASEARSSAFTGADYDSAVQAAGKPTTVAAILDRWKTQNGAIDWKVLVAGVVDTLPNFLASIAGIFINPKAPKYGAIGNGVADDWPAVQAALNDGAAGGIVFLLGQFNCYNRTLTVAADSKVCILGAGPEVAQLICDGSVDNVTYARQTAMPRYAAQFIQGVAFVMSGAGAATHNIRATGDAFDLTIRDCHFGHPAGVASLACLRFNLAAPTARVLIEGCFFDLAGVNQGAIVTPTNWGAHLKVAGCEFWFPPAYTTSAIIADSASVTGCVFHTASLTATSAMVAGAGGLGMLALSGNMTTGNNGGTVHAYSVTGDHHIVDDGNVWEGAVFSYTPTVPPGQPQGRLGIREARALRVTDDTAAFTIDMNQHAVIHCYRTVGGNITITAADPYLADLQCTVVINNTSGAVMNAVTWVGPMVGALIDDTYTRAGVADDVRANSSSIYRFVSRPRATAANGCVWQLVAYMRGTNA